MPQRIWMWQFLCKSFFSSKIARLNSFLATETLVLDWDPTCPWSNCKYEDPINHPSTPLSSWSWPKKVNFYCAFLWLEEPLFTFIESSSSPVMTIRFTIFTVTQCQYKNSELRTVNEIQVSEKLLVTYQPFVIKKTPLSFVNSKISKFKFVS